MSATTLYRLFDEQGALLYVGITNDPETRYREHANRSWWGQVDATKAEVFATRNEAAEAERVAIVTERPAFNIIYNIGNRDRQFESGRLPSQRKLVDPNERRCAVSFSLSLSDNPLVNALADARGLDRSALIRSLIHEAAAIEGLI